MASFRVGDIITGIDDCHYRITNTDMYAGIVTHNYDDSIGIVVLDHADHEEEGKKFTVDAKYFEKRNVPEQNLFNALLDYYVDFDWYYNKKISNTLLCFSGEGLKYIYRNNEKLNVSKIKEHFELYGVHIYK